MQTHNEADFVNFSTGLYSGYKLVELFFFLNSESAASFMYPAVILKKKKLKRPPLPLPFGQIKKKNYFF